MPFDDEHILVLRSGRQMQWTITIRVFPQNILAQNNYRHVRPHPHLNRHRFVHIVQCQLIAGSRLVNVLDSQNVTEDRASFVLRERNEISVEC